MLFQLADACVSERRTENMHHIIAVFSGKQKVAALAPFVQQAREKYDQNLAAYIRLILRRPLSRVVVSC